MSTPDVRATVRAALKTVQGTKHHLGLVTLDVLTDHVTEAVEQLVDAYRAENLAEGAALVEDKACDADFTEDPQYIAGLRTAAELLTQAATGEKATAPAATATPAETGRRAALIAAIRTEPARRWKSGRTVQLLRRLGYHPISPGTASRDLAALAEAGHLTRHDEKGVRWYEVGRPTTRKDRRP